MEKSTRTRFRRHWTCILIGDAGCLFLWLRRRTCFEIGMHECYGGRRVTLEALTSSCRAVKSAAFNGVTHSRLRPVVEALARGVGRDDALVNLE